MAAYGANSNRSQSGSREDWGNEYSLKETDSAAYVQSNFEGNGWSGNAGVRFVQTKEHVVSNVSTAVLANYNPNLDLGRQPTVFALATVTASAFGPYVPTVTEHTYTDVLPSLNFEV